MHKNTIYSGIRGKNLNYPGYNSGYFSICLIRFKALPALNHLICSAL